MKTLMTRTLHIFALLSLAALICGQLGRLHWFAELFSHLAISCPITPLPSSSPPSCRAASIGADFG